MKGKILLAHGSGGTLSHELLAEIFLPYFANPILSRLDDSAVLELKANGSLRGGLAFTTDSYVVHPIFFPGGDIGKLAVCGTINDLAMSGARPLYLSASFILEEGFPLPDLEHILASMQKTAEEAGVLIVAGDTKVVDKGSADQVFITTTGVGLIPQGVEISGHNARPGDAVLLSGTMGDHGIAVMSQREGLAFSSDLVSDCAPLNGLVEEILKTVPGQVHALRDPTRGGLATTLNELAEQSKVGVEIEAVRIPVRPTVQGVCELLGLDPLYVANEGKLVAAVASEAAEEVLAAMRAQPYGTEAAIIGQVTEEHSGKVVLRTSLGTRRIVHMLAGEQLPRIC